MKISEMNWQQLERYLVSHDWMVLPLLQQGIFQACITGDLNENQ